MGRCAKQLIFSLLALSLRQTDILNSFEVRTSVGITNQGTYSVRNGYIFCTYASNGNTIRIPYEIVNGDVEMDVTEAFDVMG